MKVFDTFKFQRQKSIISRILCPGSKARNCVHKKIKKSFEA